MGKSQYGAQRVCLAGSLVMKQSNDKQDQTRRCPFGLTHIRFIWIFLVKTVFFSSNIQAECYFLAKIQESERYYSLQHGAAEATRTQQVQAS